MNATIKRLREMDGFLFSFLVEQREEIEQVIQYIEHGEHEKALAAVKQLHSNTIECEDILSKRMVEHEDEQQRDESDNA